MSVCASECGGVGLPRLARRDDESAVREPRERKRVLEADAHVVEAYPIAVLAHMRHMRPQPPQPSLPPVGGLGGPKAAPKAVPKADCTELAERKRCDALHRTALL